MMPLTRVVDAARPDGAVTRRVTALVDDLLSDAPAFRSGRHELQQQFVAWRDVRPAIDATIDRAVGLHEMRPLADTLSLLGVAGLQALTYLEAGLAPAPDWRADQIALVDRAAQPVGEVELAAVGSLRRLLVAASEVSALQTMSPTQWRARVETLATR